MLCGRDSFKGNITSRMNGNNRRDTYAPRAIIMKTKKL